MSEPSLKAALESIAPLLDSAAQPWSTVAKAAVQWNAFPTEKALRSDAVADWCETHLSHYDWHTALAVVAQLVIAVKQSQDLVHQDEPVATTN